MPVITLYAVFEKLTGLVPNPVKTLPAGTYLIAVYIDNSLLQGPYSLVALPAKEGDDAAAVTHTDSALLAAKERLTLLEQEFLRNKAAYEATLAKMKDEDDLIDALLQSREDVYRNYLVSCGSAYSHETEHASTQPVEFDEFNPREDKPAPMDAQKILKAATAQASMATGWLASRFASGLASMQKAAPTHETASVASSLEGHYADTVKDEPEEEYEQASTTTVPPKTSATVSDIDAMFDEVTAGKTDEHVRDMEV